MGMLNIDEHVEERRLMAIRCPNKAVIPWQSVIANATIPFLTMTGDGAVRGAKTNAESRAEWDQVFIVGSGYEPPLSNG
jgi:hypothetical protein